MKAMFQESKYMNKQSKETVEKYQKFVQNIKNEFFYWKGIDENSWRRGNGWRS